MDFDPSTAQPAGAVAELDFDPSTAVPAGEPSPEFDPTTARPASEVKPSGPLALNEEKFRSASTSERLRMMLSHPWDKYTESVDQAFDGPDIPKVQADEGTGFVNRAGQVGAATTNTITGTASGIASAGGLSTLINPVARVYAAPRFLVGGIENIIEAYKGAGKVGLQETLEKALAGPAMIVGGLAGLGEVPKVVPRGRGLSSEIPPASPAEAIQALREEADKTTDPTAKAALEGAALKISEKAQGSPGLSNQPVKITAQTPEGVAEVELPAAEAVQRIHEHLAATVDEATKEIDSVYKQAGVEPPREPARPVVEEPAFDPTTAKPAGEEPFVSATAEALSTEPPEVKVNVFPPERHPDGRTIPGYVQFDEAVNEGRGAPMDEAKRQELPNPQAILDSGLPKGTYTLEQVNAQLAKAIPSGNFTISMKNAAIDADRVARGEEPILEQAAQADQAIWEKASKAIEQNPDIADEIVDRYGKQPAPLSAEQKAILFQRKIDLKNQFNESTRLIDGGTLSPEDVIIERDKRSRIFNELRPIEQVYRDSGGSEVGRALRFSRLDAAEDYTLFSLMAKESTVRGRKLTVEEETQIAKLSTQIEDLRRQLDAKDEALNPTPAAPPKTRRFVQVLSDRADAARQRILDRMKSGQVSAGIDPALIRDYAEIFAYHLARGVEAGVELVKEFGEGISQHLPAIRAEAEKIRVEQEQQSKLEAAKTRKVGAIVKLQNKLAVGEVEPAPRVPLVKDAEYNRIQAMYEQLKSEADARLASAEYEKLSNIGKLREQGLNTYDAARNIMTTGEFSFILRQGKVSALSHPILTAKAVPSAFRALFTDEVGARAIDLETANKPEFAAAKSARLHLVDDGAKLSRQEELFASKWAEKIPFLRNFNQAGRVFLNKLRFDVWKVLRDTIDKPTMEQDAQLAMFVNESTGRGGLGRAEPAAVIAGRIMFSPRFLASRIQLLVGHSMWGGDAVTRRIIAKEYTKTLVGLGVYYTMLAQLKDKNGKPATIEHDPRSSDFGKVKIGNTRLDPLAGVAQVIDFAARTATLETKDAKGKIISLHNPKFGQKNWGDVAVTFGRSKLHPIPGSVINLFNGTDLGGNPATIPNQAMNMAMPLTYTDIYQALEEQDLPEGVALSLLTMLGDGLQTYDTNRKRPKPTAPKK